MNLELTDEQLALRDTVRRFLAEKASVPTHVRPMLDDPTGTTDEVWVDWPPSALPVCWYRRTTAAPA